MEPVQAHDLAGGVEHARELLAEGERLLERGGEPVELLHVPREALQLPALLVDLAEQPGVLDGEHRLGREGLERGDDLGREGAPLAAQDDQAPEEPLLAHERDREERMGALPDVQLPGLRSDQPGVLLDVGDLDGLADHPGPADRSLAEPDRRRPERGELLRRHLVGGSRVKALGSLVELVQDAVVAAGELDRSADDGREHGLEVERGAHGLADLAERAELAHRPRQVGGPRLQLLEQPDVLDGDDRLVGEGLEELHLP